MPTDDSTLGRGHALFMVVQHAVASSLKSIRLRPGVHIAEMTKTILNEHNGVLSTTGTFCHTTRPVVENATLEESINLGSQPIDDQQITTTGPEALRPLGPTLQNQDNTFTSESNDLGEARRSATGEEHGSNGGSSIRSKLPRSRMVVIILGALFLIVVPGLVVGVVTKQTMWGIGLSGAMTGVVTVFAGLCKYCR